MSNFVFAPGRSKFEEVLIRKVDKTVDITALVAEVNIQSSLIDPTATGSFVVYDAKNLLSNLPLEAGDTIQVTIGYPDVQKTFKLIVEKITEIIDNQKERSYTIFAISELAYRSLHTNISRHFFGPCSDIAKVIFQENTSEKFGLWDGSLNSVNFVCPQWNPIKTIQWLARYSTSQVDTTRFFFWQDSNLIYHFAPIERMREVYKNVKIQKFIYGRINQMQGSAGSQTPDSKAAMETIESVYFHDAFDAKEQIRNGKLGGTRFQTDLTTKTMSLVNYNYWDTFNKDKSLNGNPAWGRNDNWAKGFQQFDYISSWPTKTIEYNKLNDVSNIRISSLDRAQRLDITIKGNQTVDVGQVIEVGIVSPEPKTTMSRDVFDQRWSGKYFVIAKVDNFTREGHKISMTVSKESLTNREVLS